MRLSPPPPPPPPPACHLRAGPPQGHAAHAAGANARPKDRRRQRSPSHTAEPAAGAPEHAVSSGVPAGSGRWCLFWFQEEAGEPVRRQARRSARVRWPFAPQETSRPSRPRGQQPPQPVTASGGLSLVAGRSVAPLTSALWPFR